MSFYPRLPNELKLEIWKEAMLSPGVHHFNLEVTLSFDVRPPGTRIPPGSRTPAVQSVRIMAPGASVRTDPSVWRLRASYAGVDELAMEALRDLEAKGSPKIINLQTPRNQSGRIAVVDGVGDLVCFTIKGDIYNPALVPLVAKFRLAGLKRVALEYKVQGRSPFSRVTPFTCFCMRERHNDGLFCTNILRDFFQWFKDMETFYFIVRLNYKAMKRTPRHQKRASEVGNALARFQGIARQRDLETFEDGKHTFSEVEECDTNNLIAHSQLWYEVRRLEKICKDIKIKVLVYAERQ
ncbi:hypothetical protein AAE478_010238 [Parahypoxylon ruwenzoriense]